VPGGRPGPERRGRLGGRLRNRRPVVVKPQDGNQGKGVAVNLTHREQIEAPTRSPSKSATTVLVERFLPGHDYRFLVVGDKLIAAARRDPPLVIGDGVHSIRQLVEHRQQRPAPRRRPRHLADQDPLRRPRPRPPGRRRADSRIGAGARHRVVLRNNANLSTGGTATDVTDDVHPEFAARPSPPRRPSASTSPASTSSATASCARSKNRAAASSKSTPRRACACTCNRPSARAAVGEAIIGNMFAAGRRRPHPLVAVAGTNGKTTTVRLIAHIFAANGLRVGMTSTDGVYIRAGASTPATAAARRARATC
jgi:cyanophycin synthetase